MGMMSNCSPVFDHGRNLNLNRYGNGLGNI